MKYHSVPCQGFHSKLEAAVGAILRIRERAGELKNVRRQHPVRLGEKFWKCDFSFEHPKTGVVMFCEAKGMELAEWKWIKEMWKLVGPGRLEIWGGSYQKPFMKEILEKGRFS